MPHNRNKLLQLCISNLTNVVVHKVLEESTKEDILRNHYDTQKSTYCGLQAVDKGFSGRTPPRRIPQPLGWGGVHKESMASLEVAKRYREKIHPLRRDLPDKDIAEIRDEIITRATKELELRISRGV